MASQEGGSDDIIENNMSSLGAKSLAPPLSSLNLEEMSAVEPICTPITRMESNITKTANGRLIAINKNYICYTIKGNSIRCIHFVQVTRNKLSDHLDQLVDMEFAGQNINTLASLDHKGALFIRGIYEQDGECCYSVDLKVVFPVSTAQRVKWGPPNSGLIAVACDNNVVLLNYKSILLKNAETSGNGGYPVFEADQLGEIGSICQDIEGTVSDICFSPDFQYLLVTSYDACKLFKTNIGDMSNCAMPNTVLELVSVLPTASKTLCSAMFIGSDSSIVTASANNRVLKLWKCAENGGYIQCHELLMESDAEITPWTNIEVDATASCIVLGTVDSSFFNIIHFNEDSSSFDQISKWSVSYPILSFALQTDEQNELNLFCIQTKAIQKYSLCYKDCAPAKSFISTLQQKEEVVPVQDSHSFNDLAAILQPPIISPVAPAPPLPPKSMSPRPATSPSNLSVASSTQQTPPFSSSEMEDRLLQAMSKMMDEKLKKERQVLTKELDSKLAKLSENVTKNIQNSMRKNMSEVEVKLKASIQSTSQSQGQQLKASLQSETNRMKEDIIANVLKDIKAPLQANFRECFVKLLVPSLETSTQRMFDQIDTALESHLSALPTSVVAGSGASSQSAAPSLDPKEELQVSLSQSRYEEAFMKALGAKDLELVDWLCNQVSSEVIHDNTLSQTTLLCLLQQLGMCLEVDTPLKLTWLKEISLNMDPEDSAIAAHAPAIVNELKSLVREFLATEKGRAVRTELSLILRVLP